MTMSLEKISDRMETQDLLVAYSFAMEAHDWDALDDVFTDDATIDYRELHGMRGDVAATKRFMAAASRRPGGSQYVVATSKVTIDGDTAIGRAIGHHPVVLDRDDGTTHVFFCGIWYDDRFVRTGEGWRIQERIVRRCYYHNVPPEMAFLEAEHTDDCACSLGVPADQRP
jgi:ketosteroid isomerase-like protein